MSDTSEYVARGAAAFDHLHSGPDWATLIDPATLSMEYTDQCVGAQVFGSYDACLRALGLSHDGRNAYLYGVDLEGQHALSARYAELREAWLAEVTKRL